MKTDFREGLILLMRGTNTGPTALHEATGVSVGIINKLQQRITKAPNVADAMKLAAHFCCTVEEVALLASRAKGDDDG